MGKILYIYSKCSTCQSALRFLESRKISLVVKEMTNQPPTIEELEKMLNYQNGNIKKLLNTSGLLYREMKLSEKIPTMTTAQILDLLSKHGMLIKRPFLLLEDAGLVGFKEGEWSHKLDGL